MRDRFDKFVEWYGDMIDRGSKNCFDIDDFEKYRKYILNWEKLISAVEEENHELSDGASDLWNEIVFVEEV